LQHLACEKKIEKVILISGLNDLFLSRFKDLSPNLGPFYFIHFFYRKMNNSLLRHFKLKRSQSTAQKLDVTYAVNQIKKNIYTWKAVAEFNGFEIIYFLQPTPTWLDKKLSKEEKEIFNYLSSEFQDSAVMELMNKDIYKSFSEQLKKLCIEIGISFYDLNKLNELRSEEWLFCDRAHMTDRGYQIIANNIIDKTTLN
jgi:hypothetical protein